MNPTLEQRAEAAILLGKAAQGWQTYETWPDDYFVRLAFVGGTVVSAFKDVCGQLHQQTPGRRWKQLRQKPTHWMPLPPPPTKPEGAL